MSATWPAGTRCCVSLTFEVDAETEFLSIDPEWAQHPSVMSMCRFGPTTGIWRLLTLLKQRAVPATFFVPGYVAETYPDVVRGIVENGHEVAVRGYSHESLPALSPREQADALQRAIDAVERTAGLRVSGYRAPGLDTTEYTLGMLSERGLVYDSSLMGNDVPYFVSPDTYPLVEIPVHWTLAEKPHFIFAYEARKVGPMASLAQVYRNWELEFEGAYKYERGMVLALDPSYSGYYSRLIRLERLITYIQSFPEVAIVSALDMANRWRGQQPTTARPA